MLTVYASCLFSMGALALVAVYWSALNDCGTGVAKRVGGLEGGEKWTDPWFLRLRPLPGKPYATSVDSDDRKVLGDGFSHRWMRCVRVSVTQWQISAVAETIMATADVDFTWTLDGSPLAPSTYDLRGSQSSLSVVVDPSSEPRVLAVTARDASGRAVTKSVTIDALGREELRCKAELPLPPLEWQSPAIARELPVLDAAVDGVIRTAQQIAARRYERRV